MRRILRRMRIIIVVVVLLLGAGGFWMRGRLGRSAAEPTVQTVAVQRGTVGKTVTADGTIRPLTTVDVKSYAGGTVDVLAVEVGDKVKAGDLIAKIDPTDSQTAYDQAMADLTVAQARLSQARDQSAVQPELSRASIAQAEINHTSALKDLDRLQNVTQAQARVQAKATLDKAQASLESAQKDLERLQQVTQPQARVQTATSLDRAKADLNVAEKELERSKGLKDEGLIPQSELETVESRYEAAKAAFTVAQQQSDTLATSQAAELRSAQTRVEQAEADLRSATERWRTLDEDQAAELQVAQGRVAQAKAGLDSARAQAVQQKVRQADVASAKASVDRAQAEVQNTKIMLGYTTVTAPRDGVILQKLVEQGTIISSAGRASVTGGTTLVQLGDVSRMFVDVQVDESDVADVAAGQPAKITVDALPDDVFAGAVRRVDPQAVTQQNIATVLVTVEITDRDARLLPGMTATCEFTVKQVENTLYVPSRAVQSLGDGYALRVREGEQTVQVPVEVGLVGDENTEILEGVREGTEVVLSGLMAGGGEANTERAQRAREMGRRMGGAGGFLRSDTSGGGPPPPH